MTYVPTEPAFVAGGLVGVNDALAGDAVYDRYGALICRLRRGFIALLDGVDHTFDISAHPGAKTGIVLAALFRLAGALSRLSRVGQSEYSCRFPNLYDSIN
jgi:hypothetical protein